MSHESLSWIEEELAALDDHSLRRARSIREGTQGLRVVLDGRELINFASNDYLGLASDPRLADAVRSQLDSDRWGSGASPLITGHATAHALLERRLAEFEKCEAALLFSSGFAANVGTLTALAGRGDVVFSDEKNHASIIDGCRQSRARIQVYPHGDSDYVERMLRQASGFRRRLIVTDSLFSMDGDLAPLDELVTLAECHDAMLIVDEAHATGVFGHAGRGVCEHLALEQRVPIRVGTLSKALGCVGGFVVGPRMLIDWLVNRARSYVFSTAPPAACSAAALVALDIIQDERDRRTGLAARAAALRERLQQRGWNTGSSASQIIPLIVGDAARTMRLSAALRDRGFLVPGIRPPTVPDGESLLRISLGCQHTEEMIAQLVAALGSVWDDG